MKICILGAGSLGSAIGGALAAAGEEVVLVCRSRAHVEAINHAGLRLREGDAESTVRVRAAVDCTGIGAVDLVLVLVKSAGTRAAVQAATSIIGPDTVVMSLQNGLGHEDILAQVVGRSRVLAGKTYVGGVLLEPGLVLSGTRDKETLIGEPDGVRSARTERIAAVFKHAGLATTVSADIMATMWDKLLVNVATGALSGITGLPYGDLYAMPQVRDCALAAVGEAMVVARAAGVNIATARAEDAWNKAAAGLPPAFKASMLQSLEKGARTEVDFINGAVVRKGLDLAVPTPVNSALVACIKGIEQRLFGPEGIA
jgi:2-dehydropantoate 2-reductase